MKKKLLFVLVAVMLVLCTACRQANIVMSNPPRPMTNDAVNPNEIRPVRPTPWRRPNTTTPMPNSTAKGRSSEEPAEAGSPT